MKDEATLCMYYRMHVLFLLFVGNLAFSQIYISSEATISGSEILYVENSLKSNEIQKSDFYLVGVAKEIEALTVKQVRESLSKQKKISKIFTKESKKIEKSIKKLKELEKTITPKYAVFPKIPNSDTIFSSSHQKIVACNSQNDFLQALFGIKVIVFLDIRNYKTTSQNFGEVFFLYGNSLYSSYSVRPPPFLY